MGKLILITGGARSGKSSLAEDMARRQGDRVLYIATATVSDEEMRERVRLHQARRPSGWETWEGHRQLDRVFRESGRRFQTVLLDCVTLLMTNLLYDCLGDHMEEASPEEYEKAEEAITQEVDRILAGIRETEAQCLLVTNEVGSGIVPENRLARYFRDMAGRINARIARAADEVHLVVCGCDLRVK